MAKPGVKPQEKYVDTLDSVSRKRYESKLSTIGGLDPYENGQWSDDVGLFPPVAQDDISDYLVHRTSYYTRKSFKANKQLGAHNQQTSGWVKKLLAHKPRGCDNTIITAEVSTNTETVTHNTVGPLFTLAYTFGKALCHLHFSRFCHSVL